MANFLLLKQAVRRLREADFHDEADAVWEARTELKRLLQEKSTPPPSDSPPIRICMYLDPMATIDTTVEEEYEELEERLTKLFDDRPVIFFRNVNPHVVRNNPCDVYVIDYGGMACMPGSDYGWLFRDLIETIDETPNTIFLIWSSFTVRYLKYELEELRGEDSQFPGNVILWYDDEWDEQKTGLGRLKQLLGIDP